MMPVPQNHPLRAWFAGLVESVFNVEIGMADPVLVGYLADLLTEFLHTERINLLQDGSGRNIEDVAEMVTAAEMALQSGRVNQRLTVHRHIGDFTLFWTGLYPEQLRNLRRRNDRDALLSYFEQGKRSYAIASDLSQENDNPPAALLRTLSSEFEHCVYGLGLVRKAWQSPDGAGFHAVNRFWLS